MRRPENARRCGQAYRAVAAAPPVRSRSPVSSAVDGRANDSNPSTCRFKQRQQPRSRQTLSWLRSGPRGNSKGGGYPLHCHAPRLERLSAFSLSAKIGRKGPVRSASAVASATVLAYQRCQHADLLVSIVANAVNAYKPTNAQVHSFASSRSGLILSVRGLFILMFIGRVPACTTPYNCAFYRPPNGQID
jgi:hypothetical protein